MGNRSKYIFIIFLLFNLSVFAQLHPLLENRELNKRKAAIEKFAYKGSYDSVLKAFDFFLSTQNPDGSWGKTSKSAMTSFVVLCFFTHAEIVENEKYGKAVIDAVDYLCKNEIKTNYFHSYPHAIKTYALAEATAITKNKELAKILETHLTKIINGQQKKGMFDYNYKIDENRQDLSFSSWNFQAIKAAFVAGSKNDKLKPAMQKASEWLKIRCSDNLHFPYSTQNNQLTYAKARHTMRAAGTLSMQIFNEGNYRELSDELKFIAMNDLAQINWNDPPKESLYGWYFATQTMFNKGGVYWRAWNRKISPELMENQNRDGSWNYTGDHHGRGLDAELTQKIYATSLCTLILCTPFRYKPNAPFIAGQPLIEE